MYRYLLSLFAIIVLCFSQVLTIKAEDDKLNDAYSDLDEAIERSNEYEHKKQQQVELLQQKIAAAKNDNELYKLQLQLYDTYDGYSNPKALECLNKCMEIATKREDAEPERFLCTLLAYQYASGGYYTEALAYLDRIKTTDIKPRTESSSLFARAYIYGELAAHSSNNKELAAKYTENAQRFRMRFFGKGDKSSQQYYQLRVSQLLSKDSIAEAFNVCETWGKKVKKDSKELSLVAYYMSECCRMKKNIEKQCYWLAISAACGIKDGVMNQTSLWTLADILSEKGDQERSQRYIDFAIKCCNAYGGHLQSWQVAPAISTISNNYSDTLSEKTDELKSKNIAVSILAILLVLSILMLYLFIKKFMAARWQLHHIKNQAVLFSAQPQETRDEAKEENGTAEAEHAEAEEDSNEAEEENDENTEEEVISEVEDETKESEGEEAENTGIQSQEINPVHKEFLARFLCLCASYIDKIDDYRLRVNGQLKANQIKELLKMTGSSKLRDDAEKELFGNFDELVLQVYPNFVEEFNSLLQPQYRQKLGARHSLTTDMRMAALIRLGIDDSASIAEFLQLSPNTVYNYRARMKSKAIDRSGFEDRIKANGNQKMENEE